MTTETVADSTGFDKEILLQLLIQIKGGDFTGRMPSHWTGLDGKIADCLNEIVIGNQALGVEIELVSQAVGKEGKLSQRVSFRGSNLAWANCIDSVNRLIDDLVRPSTEMQRVIGAVADGDLSKKVSVEVQGEMLELKNTINGMVDQLNEFISEVTRVAREVGTEGKLGQAAAYTIEVGGAWRELIDNVNLMAGNLTDQVRDIAEVTTAVADGDLTKKITADVRGEFLELKNTVNAMVDQLRRFAGEVTRVAREVGMEGKLGGQAQSSEVAGVWKDLTDDVNHLAANLTSQVRAISEVAAAVTQGDLTRQVTVVASGEVAVLKDKLNEMIGNLRETMRQNAEQDWLKTHLERFTRMLQGHRDLATVSNMILSELAPLVSAEHGVFYMLTKLGDGGTPVLQFQAGYGYTQRKHLSNYFRIGEGLVGQCASEKKSILLTNVPADYIQINSGLGEATPLNIIVLPILFEGSVRAVVELASFTPFSSTHQSFLDQLTEGIGLVLNTVEATAVTEELLEQARSHAQELQSRQDQLTRSNADLANQATLLADKNSEVERKYQEVEEAKHLVEEKANELLVSSKYKSEFIANMSHELRTPLNSLLVLAEQLEDNADGNLTERQVSYAHVIRSSGRDLLKLLNDILDLAKVESNTMTIEIADVSLRDVSAGLANGYEAVAKVQGLEFSIDVDDRLPATISTDPHRLRQILNNILSNAFKFTEEGRVAVRFDLATTGWSADCERLGHANAVVAISISDTGIGIDQDVQSLMFEAFAQADGTTARKYGGTGLGLAISRDLVSLLGGEITLSSEPAKGSVFTVFLPVGSDERAIAPTSPEPALSPARQLHAPSGSDSGDRHGLRPSPSLLLPPAAVHGVSDAPAVDTNGTPTAAVGATGTEPSVPPIVQAGTSKHTAKGAVVLVVDDDPRNVFALSVLLERSQLTVVAATSGAEALAILAGDRAIDIVLMDIMMPEMDGYQTMTAIRQLPLYLHCPIIAVTGKVVAGERARCLDAGASDYVPKPVDTAELLGAMAKWMPARPEPQPAGSTSRST